MCLRLLCRKQGAFGAGRRVITCPAMKSGVDESRIRQHFQEQPLPNRAGNSVGPSALVGHFFRCDVFVQQNVSHLKPTAGL